MNNLSQATDLQIISNCCQHRHTVASERCGFEIRLCANSVTLDSVFNLHEFSGLSRKMALTLLSQWGYIQECIIQWVGSNAWKIIYFLENLIMDCVFPVKSICVYISVFSFVNKCSSV